MKDASSFTWDEAAVAELRRRAALGESASVMGGALGVSRNAVLGKCMREKITLESARTLKGSGSRHLEERLQERRQAKPSVPRVKAAPPVKRPTPSSYLTMVRASPELAEHRAAEYGATPARKHAFDPSHAPEGARIVRLEALGKRECKWPLYEDGPMLFCGCKVTTFDRNGQPDVYCEAHLEMRRPRAAS